MLSARLDREASDERGDSSVIALRVLACIWSSGFIRVSSHDDDDDVNNDDDDASDDDEEEDAASAGAGVDAHAPAPASSGFSSGSSSSSSFWGRLTRFTPPSLPRPSGLRPDLGNGPRFAAAPPAAVERT